MTAAAASAQPYTSGYNFNIPAPTNYVMLPPVSDEIFKCGNMLSALCSDEDRKRLTNILRTRTCPQPVSYACANYLMMNTDSGVFQYLGNQSNPATAFDEFYKKCGTAPYRGCTDLESTDRDAWLKWKPQPKADAPPKEGARYDQEPGFVGPPLPSGWGSQNGNGGVVSNTQATPLRLFAPMKNDADFKKTFQEIQKSYGDAPIDMGDNTYAILDKKGDGMMICGQGGCTPAKQSDHQDKIQQARAEDKSFSGTSGGGTPPAKAGGQKSGGDGPPVNEAGGRTADATGGGGSPRDKGASFARESGIGGAGTSGSGEGSEQTVALKFTTEDRATIQGKGFTYIKTAEINEQVSRQEKAFAGGQPGFAAPNEPLPGTVGDPPVDERYLGKIQAVANDGSAAK